MVADTRPPPFLPSVLVISDLFLPGYRGGGPIRTLANLIDHCRSYFHFRVVTRDRDHLATHPYPGVKVNEWQELYGCEVMYLSPRRCLLNSLRKLIRSAPHDIIYLNSFFSTLSIKVLLLWRVGLIPQKPLILAPRGEFSPGALTTRRSKYLKKIAFIHLSKLLNFHKGILWQATSEMEKRHILTYFRGKIVIAPNLPARVVNTSTSTISPAPKQPGRADLIFVSRIAVKKNLDYVLELLQQVSGEVVFDIFGPIEDPAYWKKCTSLINQMPPNVKVRYCGEIRHDAVAAAFARHHFFLFPTRGENFGHVIVESLAAGCPVVTSDQTPWRDLEKNGAGWDISLADRRAFLAVLQHCIQMDSSEYAKLSKGARDYGRKFLNDAVVQANRQMFKEALSKACQFQKRSKNI